MRWRRLAAGTLAKLIVVTSALVVALLVVIVVDSIRSRDRALEVARVALLANRDQAAQSSLEVDGFRAQIRDLTDQLRNDDADLIALSTQVRKLGAKPVVTVLEAPTSPPPSTAPPAAPPTTTTSVPPAGTTTTAALTTTTTTTTGGNR